MELGRMRESLSSSGRLILASYEGVPEEIARFCPERGRWSMIEILGHLRDEERDDFRQRMRLTIEEPTADWPPIRPEAPREQQRQDIPIEDLLGEFRKERGRSLAWLTSLDDSCLEALHTHPEFGSMNAGDILASWCAHDFLHLAQIARARLAWVKEHAEPFSTAYAGG